MRLHLSNQTSRSKPAQYTATSAYANRRHPRKERSTSPARPPQKNHRDSQEGIHHCRRDVSKEKENVLATTKAENTLLYILMVEKYDTL